MNFFDNIHYMNFKDTVDMALTGEFISRLLDEYIDLLVKKNKLKDLTDKEMKKLRSKVLDRMQEKYPDAGIVINKKEDK